MASLPYALAFSSDARTELAALKAFERQRITEAIRVNLTHEPFRQTRNRKPLPGMVATFEHNRPLWELRVGECRVFYDQLPKERALMIRAVRRKGHGKTTQEITR